MRPARGSLNTSAVGSLRRDRAANPYTVVSETPTSISDGSPEAGVVHPLAGLVAGNGPDGVGDTAQLATDLPADHPAGERAPDVTARLELPGREDRVVEALRLHRVLHELDHLFFGHGPNRIARACAAEGSPARLPATTEEDAVAFPRDEIEATVERYVGVRADIDAGRGTWSDLAQFFTDDAVFIDPAWGRVQGIEEMKATVFGDAMVGFEDWTFPVEFFAIDGDNVVIKWKQVLGGAQRRRFARTSSRASRR